MAERSEVETLTIRTPMRMQRRGGRKLIMTQEGAAVPSPKPRPDETLIWALVRAHRWRRQIERGKAPARLGGAACELGMRITNIP